MFTGKKYINSKAVECDELVININIKNRLDFFGDSGYTYFRNRMLNNKLEEYVLKGVMRYPLNRKVRIVLYIHENNRELDPDVYKEAILSHFYSKMQEIEMFLKEQLKQWSINMLIGILFLMLCFICVEVLDSFTYIKIVKVVKESLLIIGWVALWEPVTFILFGRRSINRNKKYYRKLSKAKVEVIRLAN